MLHSLRKQRHTLGRGLVSVLVAVWLSLALQPCAMAADAVLGQGMKADCMQQDKMSSKADCYPGMTCASMMDPGVVDAALLIQPLTAQPVVIAWTTLEYPTSASQLIPNHLPHSYNPPPLLRFCILQV